MTDTRQATTEANPVDELLDMRELCALLKVPAATIYQLTHRANIPHFKIANRIRFRRSEIRTWIEERRVTKSRSSTT